MSVIITKIDNQVCQLFPRNTLQNCYTDHSITTIFKLGTELSDTRKRQDSNHAEANIAECIIIINIYNNNNSLYCRHTHPADTQRKKYVIMTSKQLRFDVVMTLSLRRVLVGQKRIDVRMLKKINLIILVLRLKYSKMKISYQYGSLPA